MIPLLTVTFLLLANTLTAAEEKKALLCTLEPFEIAEEQFEWPLDLFPYSSDFKRLPQEGKTIQLSPSIPYTFKVADKHFTIPSEILPDNSLLKEIGTENETIELNVDPNLFAKIQHCLEIYNEFKDSEFTDSDTAINTYYLAEQLGLENIQTLIQHWINTFCQKKHQICLNISPDEKKSTLGWNKFVTLQKNKVNAIDLQIFKNSSLPISSILEIIKKYKDLKAPPQPTTEDMEINCCIKNIILIIYLAGFISLPPFTMLALFYCYLENNQTCYDVTCNDGTLQRDQDRSYSCYNSTTSETSSADFAANQRFKDTVGINVALIAGTLPAYVLAGICLLVTYIYVQTKYYKNKRTYTKTLKKPKDNS